MSNSLEPEAPFALASTLFVLCLGADSRWVPRWLAGGFALMAYLLRTAGSALLVAWVGDSLFRRDFRSVLRRFGVSLLAIVAWHSYISIVEVSPSYAQPAYPYQRAEYLYHNVSYLTNASLREPFYPELGRMTFREAAGRFAYNLTRLPASLGEGVSAPRGYWEEQIRRVRNAPVLSRVVPGNSIDAVLIILGGVVVGGVIFQLGQGQRVIPLYLVGYVLVVSSTPWPIHWPRYWSPVAPLLVLAGLQCARALYACRDRLLRSRGRSGRPAALEVAIGLILAIDIAGVVGVYVHSYQRVEYQDRHGRPVVYRLFFYRDAFRAFDAGLDWLRYRAKPTDVVATAMPHWVYLRTGLRSVMPPAERDSRRVLDLLDSVPVTYVMAGGSTAVLFAHQYAFPAVRHAPDVWTPVYRDPGGELVVYRRGP